MRLRIIFSKTDAMRYTGHLDLHRTWERTIRRAQLPLAYSQGYNPRPKIILAAALPLGFTSTCEIVEIWLEQTLPIDQVKTFLEAAVPPGIEIGDILIIEGKSVKLPNLVEAADYEVTLFNPFPDLDARINHLLESPSQVRERRGKSYDLRPLIESINNMGLNSSEGQKIRLRLAARTGATGRPDEVLDALGIPPHEARIERTALHLGTPRTETG
jgi:radical SAM-linked protein